VSKSGKCQRAKKEESEKRAESERGRENIYIFVGQQI